MKKYPKLFQNDTYTYENIKWIFTHLKSRCFGSKILEYDTMAPIVEMLNHESTNVHYTVNYEDQNIHKPEDFNSLGES